MQGRRPPRLLLTLATGTGKTQVAFQLLWKLKRERVVRNVLFLTDRDFLLTQAMENEFSPFGDARYRIHGEPSTAYDMNFAIYQGITSANQSNQLRYLNYPANFFQVIVVDECHRGSASEDSEWRKVLNHFSGAIQIGLTATPLSTETVQTDDYFGESLYSYSLRMGINDGFLAPYRVRRILLGQAVDEEQLATPDEEQSLGQQADEEQLTTTNEDQEEQATVQVVLDEDEFSLVDIPVSMETPTTMMTYTEPIARHLAAFLQRTDPFAKTIVFCANQKHAELMRIALVEACAPWAATHADYVVRIVSDEGPEGKRALGNFTTPDERFPVIVTTSKLLGTGVDVPTCRNIVLARPVGSIVEFKQIIGRGTRLFEPQKRWFTILDYAGTIKHFFDPNFDGDPEFAEKETLLLEPVEAGGVTPSAEASTPDAEELSSALTPTQPFLAVAGDVESENAHDETLASPERPVSVQEEQEPSSKIHEQTEGYQPAESACTCAPLSSQEAAPYAASGDVSGETENALGEHEYTDTTEQIDPANPPAGMPVTTKHTRSGRVLKVIGEIVYELGSDGSTLRRGSYREYTVTTMHNLVSTVADLRARWLKDEQRAEILNRLGEEGVDLGELAYSLHLMEVDALDLILHVVFQEPVVTRAQRAERLRREQTAFFKRYENNLLARAILDVILDKYVRGEAPDVSDVTLLQVMSLADRHTPLELSRPFLDAATGSNVRTVLKELQTLLYSV